MYDALITINILLWLFELGFVITELKFSSIEPKHLIFMAMLGGYTVKVYKLKIEKDAKEANEPVQKKFYQKLLIYIFWFMALLPVVFYIIGRFMHRF